MPDYTSQQKIAAVLPVASDGHQLTKKAATKVKLIFQLNYNSLITLSSTTSVNSLTTFS